jgi:hypothetical protein
MFECACTQQIQVEVMCHACTQPKRTHSIVRHTTVRCTQQQKLTST